MTPPWVPGTLGAPESDKGQDTSLIKSKEKAPLLLWYVRSRQHDPLGAGCCSPLSRGAYGSQVPVVVVETSLSLPPTSCSPGETGNVLFPPSPPLGLRTSCPGPRPPPPSLSSLLGHGAEHSLDKLHLQGTLAHLSFSVWMEGERHGEEDVQANDWTQEGRGKYKGGLN